jgi:hypothetical protein
MWTTKRLSSIAVCFFFCAGIGAQTPLGPGFTYQGEIQQNGTPVDGTVHLRFSLWDAETDGARIGVSQTPTDIPVAEGLFTVVLNASGEFGPTGFNGEGRWLQIEVCGDPNCSSLSIMSPRQPITGAPYALHASNAGTAPWTGLSDVPEGFADGVDNIGEITWEASGTNIYRAMGNVGIGTSTPATPLHVVGGIPSTLQGDGSVVIGRTESSNLAFDDTSIMARLNGAGGTFFLNEHGGNVSICGRGIGRLGVGTFTPLGAAHIHAEPVTFGGTLTLEGDTHTYMSFFPDGVAAGRGGWLGYGGPLDDNLYLVNGLNNIFVDPGGGDGFHVLGYLFAQNMLNGDFHDVQWNSVTGEFFYDDSTRRHKENITPLQDDFERLLGAQPMTYTRPGRPDRREIGYIAEDIEDLGLTRLLQFDQEGRPESVNFEKAVLYLTEIAKA